MRRARLAGNDDIAQYLVEKRSQTKRRTLTNTVSGCFLTREGAGICGGQQAAILVVTPWVIRSSAVLIVISRLIT